jgi:hypothetical protein
MTDLNKARTNMLNWIQPDLIVTRSLMTLNRYFRKEVEHAFELIKGQEEDPELERSWLNDTDNNTFSEPAVKRSTAII